MPYMGRAQAPGPWAGPMGRARAGPMGPGQRAGSRMGGAFNKFPMLNHQSIRTLQILATHLACGSGYLWLAYVSLHSFHPPTSKRPTYSNMAPDSLTAGNWEKKDGIILTS